jgi:hypothetical protein
MYTEHMNDDKRDFVEYTSMGFLGQPHTMVTYTRAGDSVLCVPLMIDEAVWCDCFSAKPWSYDKVAKALASADWLIYLKSRKAPPRVLILVFVDKCKNCKSKSWLRTPRRVVNPNDNKIPPRSECGFDRMVQCKL